jgi:hypothetical protein
MGCPNKDPLQMFGTDKSKLKLTVRFNVDGDLQYGLLLLKRRWLRARQTAGLI